MIALLGDRGDIEIKKKDVNRKIEMLTERKRERERRRKRQRDRRREERETK